MTVVPPGADAGPDRGAGTPLLLGVVGVLVGLAVTLSLLGQAAVARHRAEAAADLAALAAADVLLGRAEGGACTSAARTARDNGASLVSCRPAAGATVTVEVVVRIRGPGAALGVASATGRAGPAP